MDTKDLAIRCENVFTTFLIGWQSFLMMFFTTFKATIKALLGQLFGILMVSLAPVLEYREMIDISETPDGWIYLFLSISGSVIFAYYLWKFFVVLGAVNLLARDIYENRAIANISFYTSDILRKKGSYFRFLIGYLFIALIFSAITALVLYSEQKLIVYNYWTNIANFGLIVVQSAILLGYILFSNIALQGYVFNRLIGFVQTVAKIIDFIKKHFIPLTILSFLTVLFSNIIAYVTQIITTFLVINPFNLYGDNSIGIFLRFTAGFIANGFVVVFLQYIYTRLYLISEECEKMY